MRKLKFREVKPLHKAKQLVSGRAGIQRASSCVATLHSPFHIFVRSLLYPITPPTPSHHILPNRHPSNQLGGH